MSRAQSSDGGDVREDDRRLGDDWYQRHARIAPRTTARSVREAQKEEDDWDARHGRRTRSN